jgi:NDP-sugar pyrophosphorylase family protein
MQALILAGGQGTRLRPYTTLIPKALVPLGDIPVLELVLRQLKYYGFNEITLSVGHLAALLQAYFGDGRKWGVEINYLLEEKALGTAGPIAMLEDLPEDFLVMNADIVSDINYGELFEYHKRQKSVATVSVYQRVTQIEFGVLDIDPKTQRIGSFVEKPKLEHTVSIGVNVFNKRVKELIPENEFFGFDHLVKALLQENATVHAYPFSGYWLDIGRVDDYETAVNDFNSRRSVLLPDSR